MRFCFCNQPVFATDKNTKIGYCKSHQYLRADLSKKSITQKAMEKKKDSGKIRSRESYQSGYVAPVKSMDSVTSLKMDLDSIVSKYIRLRDMDNDGKIFCFCCDKELTYKSAQCMHFIDRVNMATRFLISNLKSGCYECNCEKDGNLKVYAERLELETPGIVDFLNEQSRIVASISPADLKEILIEFQYKFKMVEHKLLLINSEIDTNGND